MTEQEKSQKVIAAEEALRQAKARLSRVKKEEKEKLRKEQNHHKYMMGGVVAKYFPECFEFNEQEMNRIIACAFSLRDVQNMISRVVNERAMPDQQEELNIEEEEIDENEENISDDDEGEDDDE